MKSLLAALLALILPLLSQEIEKDKEKLIEALMNAPNLVALNKAIKTGKEAGLPNQLFLEARFIYFVNEDNRPALAALSPELQAHLPKFSPDNTMIFAVKEDFASIVKYTQALEALQKNDAALFKRHITEAFWLAPSHAAQFAPLIDDMRIEEAMKKITLDLNLKFKNQKLENQSTSLKNIVSGSQAFLIHFWSPWVDQSVAAMAEIATISNTLIKNKIPVASILLSSTDEGRRDADKFLFTKGADSPGHWLVDTEKSSLSSLMRVSSFPTVVLASKEGKILFNGDPADGRLWNILRALNPLIFRPKKDLVLPKIEQKTTTPTKNRK